MRFQIGRKFCALLALEIEAHFETRHLARHFFPDLIVHRTGVSQVHVCLCLGINIRIAANIAMEERHGESEHRHRSHRRKNCSSHTERGLRSRIPGLPVETEGAHAAYEV